MKHIYEILDLLKDTLESQPQTNTVSYGDFFTLDLDKKSIYPIAHIELGTTRFTPPIAETSISIILADIVDVNKEDVDVWQPSNIQDILNTQLGVADYVVSVLNKKLSGYVEFADCEPFVEEFTNNLAGYVLTFTIKAPTNTSIC